ncbi:hypothetical protein Fmac_029256 [Flemingia macrophylla]|uniref:Uncharacterized protein n=1 Tax=Flemingia macrophylla TaxID=520843 RepID=A0ABD1L9U5_9FABA
MGKDSREFGENTQVNHKMEEVEREEIDTENNPLNEPLLKRSRTLSSNPLALIGEKVSYIESLDYE